MKLRTLLATMVLTVATITTTVAHGESDLACTGLGTGALKVRGDLPPRVLDRIQAMAQKVETLPMPAGVTCKELGKILGRLVNGSFQGGKKLEDNQPLDVAKAQTELEQALQQNPELKTQLDGLRDAVSDDQVRMLYEAALLQSNNLYGARDLRLQQLIEQAKGG